METTTSATKHECGRDGSGMAPGKAGRRMGRLFMAGVLTCLGMAVSMAGTAKAANKEVTILTKVRGSGENGEKVVEAIKAGNIAALDAILERGKWDIDAPIDNGWGGKTLDLTSEQWELMDDTYYGPVDLWGTPLMYAARLGRVRVVKHLLELGANPNVMLQTGGVWVRDQDLGLGRWDSRETGKRPFICALTDAYMLENNGWLEGKTPKRADQIGQMLIEAGAVLPPEDVWGRNALWDAAIARSPRLFNLCLQSGLDPDEEDNVGHTVMDDIDATLENLDEDSEFHESLFDFKRILEKSASAQQP